MQFTFDEPVSYDERRDWWYELAPIYHAGHAQVHCTPRILVSTYAEWDCELLPITPAPLTVEADGYGSHRYFPFFAWDYHMLMYGRRDIVSERKEFYQLWHNGRLSHVSPCEVTL